MMFSTNPFAQFASSIHVFPPPNSFLETEKDDLYINNHLTTTNPFVAGDCCLHPYSPSSFTTSKQDSGGNLEGLGLEQYDDEHNHHVLRSEASPRKKKKPSKKDHHSKIYTAQGPRDRRVRLSIDVARKFFYLQDLLGFDKASKTLDWLFNKSKIPIDELIQGRKNSSSPTVTDESEIVFLETFKEGSDEFEEDKGQKRKSTTKCSNGKRKKIPRKYKSEGPVNQSRAEARARARERTKEKLSIKKLDDESKKIHGDCCSCCCCPGSPSYSKLQSSFWSAIESQNHHNDRFREALMEEKISMLHSYQHPHQNSINGEL